MSRNPAVLKGNVEAGLKVTPLDFAKAEQVRAALFRCFAELFEKFACYSRQPRR